jgi:glutamine synthetase
MSVKSILKTIEQNQVKFIDLRFTDMRGKEHHISIPSHMLDEALFQEGKMIDGSSIKGFKHIHQSDMALMPDPDTAMLDPFTEHSTLILRCDVYEPATGQPYNRDPRSLAKRAEAYLLSTGIATASYFGPEPEFFVFDDVRWENGMHGAMYKLNSAEAAWNSGAEFMDGNTGHRPGVKGGYFPVPPVDSSHDIRSAMCIHLEQMGLIVEAHHHEVATANQNEISTKFNTLLRKADDILTLKYGVHNTAHAFGKTATFMPKPLVGDNGNGMHCHQSLAKDGVNLFMGNGYAGLSDLAMYYIGGIIKHARALNAFTNASTNSYRRLVPGFEAPVMLAYSARNRSAAIRIPYSPNPKASRIEVRFPDPAINPYYAFTAMLMAGLDGIQNKIHPGEAMDMDLYELSAADAARVPKVCFSLSQALDELSNDREFLLQGNVFDNDLIDAYIGVKQYEVQQIRMATHPLEFDLYYSL